MKNGFDIDGREISFPGLGGRGWGQKYLMLKAFVGDSDLGQDGFENH